MDKRVILVTGTPCTGKTSVAKQLTAKLDAFYINLTEFAEMHGLTLGEDKERKTIIIDEEGMRQKIAETISATDNVNIIIDGHYASAVTLPDLATHVFVLRRNPIELKLFMQKCGFEGAKLWENLAAEILDTCLVEALETQHCMICELDATGKTIEETVSGITDVLEKGKKCYGGFVDWLGMLEKEGLTGEYLKF